LTPSLFFIDSLFFCCYEAAIFEMDKAMKHEFLPMNNWWWQTDTQEGFVRR
jgi:hypothetical protein